MFKRRRKGQSTLEYAILIVIVIGALITIQAYVKRGLQGRLKSATDDIGEQFDPGNTNSIMTTSFNSQQIQNMNAGQRNTQVVTETTDVNGFSEIFNTEQTFWASHVDLTVNNPAAGTTPPDVGQGSPTGSIGIGGGGGGVIAP